jgi:hypothetical protein
MQTLITWTGRIALLAVFALAFAGAIDPHHNARRSAPPPDVVEHVAYGYLLTILAIVALPRVNPWIIGGACLGLGVGFEVLQIAGLVSGTFQAKDLASNLAGVGAALIPLALGQAKRR